MQKLCCVCTRQHSLPVWIISSQVHHRISTNSQPFLVGIVSTVQGYPEHKEILGRWLGPAIDIGPAMTSKVLKGNGQVIYTSTYHAIADDEMAKPEEVKARQAFDAALATKLGAPMSKHDLPSEGVDADTPTFELYEDDENPPLWLPDADEVTPEVADSYVGAQVNLPIGGPLSKALSSAVHETPMGISKARLTSILYSIRKHMKLSSQMDAPRSSPPTRYQSTCSPSVIQRAISTF